MQELRGDLILLFAGVDSALRGDLEEFGLIQVPDYSRDMAGFRDMSGFRIIVGFRIIAGLMDMVCFRVMVCFWVMVCFRVMADFRPQSIRNIRTSAKSQPYLNASDTKHPTFSTHFRQACHFWHDIGISFGCT